MVYYNMKAAIATLGMVLFMLPFGLIHAQDQSSQKVHKIKEINITSNRKNFYSEDQKTTIIDSGIIENNRSNNLDELLSTASHVYIKSYGAQGSLAVPNLRGTQGGHTSVTWNGFPINSLTLGQSDLSQTPVEFVDKISITHSAPGTLYGSGTFGGSIGLENNANWEHGNSLTVSSEIGSWNNQRYSLQSELGNQKFRYKLSGFFQKAKNDFEYHDTQQFGTPLKKQRNNALQNRGLMQNFYFKASPRSKFEAGVWLQERDKEIPEIMGNSEPGTARQRDSTLRIYGQWKRVFDAASLQLRSGYFYHNQLYTEKESPGDNSFMIYSPLETKKWMNNLNYRYYLNNRINFDIGGQYSHIKGNVDEYGKTITDYRAALIGAFKYNYQRLTANFSIRQQFNKYTSPPPQFGIGANYNFIPNKLYIRSHFSTKYKLPSLNDKYWQPGGNKNINPEHGWSGEMGIGYSPDLNGHVQSLQSEITVYTSKINDLIQWIPAEGESYWHAINTSKVRNSGVEATAKLNVNWGNFMLDLKSVYNYTRSINLNKDKPNIFKNQLKYTPYHTLKNALVTKWYGYAVGTNINYTGKRYTTADNEKTLDSYSVLDIFMKKQFEFKNFDTQLKLTVKNVLDREYQIIAHHPMPGRAYYINLKIQLNKLIN